MNIFIMSPLYRGGDILLYLSVLSCSSDLFCVCAFSPSIVQAVKHKTLTQCRAIVGPPSTTLISPVLGYRVMFDATLNVGQRHRRRANINQTLVFYLNSPKSLKNKQKTVTRHTGTSECGYPTSFNVVNI